jgi:hypothetical protein
LNLHLSDIASDSLSIKRYAFLGLVDSDHGIKINYNPENTLGKVMIETTYQIVRRERYLGILMGASWKGYSDLALPSWVPDWSCLPTGSFPSYPNRIWALDPEASFSDDRKILFVNAVHLATFLGGDVEFAEVEHDEGFQRRLIREITHPPMKGLVNGDEVWALFGTELPFVLCRTDHTFRLVARISVWLPEIFTNEQKWKATNRTPQRLAIS